MVELRLVQTERDAVGVVTHGNYFNGVVGQQASPAFWKSWTRLDAIVLLFEGEDT